MRPQVGQSEALRLLGEEKVAVEKRERAALDEAARLQAALEAAQAQVLISWALIAPPSYLQTLLEPVHVDVACRRLTFLWRTLRGILSDNLPRIAGPLRQRFAPTLSAMH